MSDTEILEKRARALASARVTDTDAIDAAQSARYLLAHCGKERVAIRLTSVAEIYRPASVTPLPATTPPLWGMSAWRGRIIAVMTIGDCVPGPGDGLLAVLVEGKAVFGALWLSLVEGEVMIHEQEVHDAGMNEGRGAFFTGVTSDAVLVLDAPRLKAALEGGVSVRDTRIEQNSKRSTG